MFWKVILIIILILLILFAILEAVALILKPSSVYKNDPDKQNKFEGKKIVFVEDSNFPENADGKKGYLQAVGDSDYKQTFYGRYIKRFLDIILSFGGLVLLSPIFLTISIAIYIDDPGPVLFTQKRVGLNKQYFKLHKFRSMKVSTPKDVPTHMLDNPDSYITKVGGFCRRHSIDELPQIWDVFIGNMSIVGPRPALWNQECLIAEREKYNANDIKCGLTGYAQINGRDGIDIIDKAILDGKYVKDISFKADFGCFFGSVHVFKDDENVIEGKTKDVTEKNA